MSDVLLPSRTADANAMASYGIEGTPDNYENRVSHLPH